MSLVGCIVNYLPFICFSGISRAFLRVKLTSLLLVSAQTPEDISMILIDQIPKVCKIKLNAQCFCAIATAELFQAEWTSLTKKINDEFAVRTAIVLHHTNGS